MLRIRPPRSTPEEVRVRLACIRHAASVDPEPGSNSPPNPERAETHRICCVYANPRTRHHAAPAPRLTFSTSRRTPVPTAIHHGGVNRAISHSCNASVEPGSLLGAFGFDEFAATFVPGETRPVSGAKEILPQRCGCVKDLRRAIFAGGGIGADVAGGGFRAYYW